MRLKDFFSLFLPTQDLQLTLEQHGFELLGSICIWIFFNSYTEICVLKITCKICSEMDSLPLPDTEWVICNVKIINVLISYCFITFLLKNYITVQYAFKVAMQSKGNVEETQWLSSLAWMCYTVTFYRPKLGNTASLRRQGAWKLDHHFLAAAL